MNTPAAAPAVTSIVSAPSPDSTLGARLAAASRQAQGFTAVVRDPSVLAELRQLCTAPKPTTPPVDERREGPAP